MKLIIIDDNILDSNGMNGLIYSNIPEIEVIGIYSNGKQALPHIIEKAPDIIITDIYMPLMNGIEMVKNIRKLNINSRIIFVSCHNEFEYAKSAVDFDVDSYISKPFPNDEFISAVKKSIELAKAEHENHQIVSEFQKRLPILQNAFFKELLHEQEYNQNEIRHDLDFLGIKLFKNGFFAVASIMLKASEKQNEKNFFLFHCFVEKFIDDYNAASILPFIIRESLTEYIIIFNYTAPYENVFEFLNSLSKSLSEATQSSLQIALSEQKNAITELHKLYIQVKYIMSQNYYFSKLNDIITYENLDAKSASFSFKQLELSNMYDDIREIIFSSGTEPLDKFINKLFDNDYSLYSDIYVKNILSITIMTLQIILNDIKKSISDIIIDDYMLFEKIKYCSTIHDIKNWIYNILNFTRQELIKQSSSEYYTIVNKIKDFIRKNYHMPITIEAISSGVYLSPKYANKIFKNIENMTIFDYLTDYRMNAAKKMLQNTDNKLYTIASSIGYKNVSHFCLTFKKYTGMTPNEFRQKKS